jgi:ABC-2 type transport system ATP-binding protein
MIQIKNLSKSFGKLKVLDAINLEFEQGKVYGVLGENGAGKTTLFRCISGLESCKGKVESSYHKLKDVLGYLPTEPYILSFVTGKEYIRLLLKAKGLKAENIEELNLFDLPLNRYVSDYSTGMKKKLALTAVLLQKNDVVILDEPFNGVDIHSNMLISDLILELKALGKTILISSHIFSSLTKLCDEMILLKSGKLVAQAKIESEFELIESTMKEELRGRKMKYPELK